MKTAMIVCGIDDHLPRIKKAVENIRAIFEDDVDIGISTFGGPRLKASNLLKEYAAQHKLLFYDAPRQKWVTRAREFHCCEVIGMLTASKHFYDKGYDRVYLLHNDIVIKQDFRKLIELGLKNGWSFVAPVRKTVVRDHISLDLPTSEALQLHSHQLAMTTTRISQECVLLNKKFIDAMYGTYGTEEQMWLKLFVYSNMHGDLALADLQHFLGFEAILTKPFIEHGY